MLRKRVIIRVGLCLLGTLTAVVLLAAAVQAVKAPPEPPVTVDFFDIGQGDSILIQRGSRQVLLDGGPDRLVLTRLGRTLPFSDRFLETVVCTHPHDDHTVGLESVLERYQVGRLVIPAAQTDHEGWSRLLAVAERRQVPVETVVAGDRFDWGPSLRATVLWPPADCPEIVRGQDGHHDVSNSCSLVLRLEGKAGARPWRMLLMGDATTVSEAWLLARQAVGPVDLLKVGHHGSRYSSSSQFLKTVQPAHAVVCVGEKNRFGHPDLGVLLRLSSVGSAVWRTDHDSGIRAVPTADGLRVTAGHGR